MLMLADTAVLAARKDERCPPEGGRYTKLDHTGRAPVPLGITAGRRYTSQYGARAGEPGPGRGSELPVIVTAEAVAVA
jgi:hypothetical protein